MSDYTEPNNSEFTSGEQVILDIMSTVYPKLMTTSGSVLREVVVRPLAYVYAWLTANFNDMRKRTTMSYLRMSNATDDPVADAVASNYFVTRRAGVRSKGVVTVILNTETTQFDSGDTFNADGIALATPMRTIVMGSRFYVDNGVQYVPSIPYDTANGLYLANIPVYAVESGNIELAPGASVAVEFANSSIESVMLTSPVSGGRDVETDAELMARAEYNTASAGVGSYYGIKKKLANSPVDVLGLSIVAGEDGPMWRARYNTVGVSPGGYVDCYVKTYNQYAVDTLVQTITHDTPQTHHEVEIRDEAHAGLFAVTQLTVNGTPVTNYSVAFGSSLSGVPAAGARLSTLQTLILTFDTNASLQELQSSITVMYMPGVSAIQTFMDSDVNQFVGQSLLVKGAVPITVTLACKLEYNGTPDENVINGIKQCMAARVNAYPVGAEALNFSDLQDAVRTSYPEASIRLPCSMTGSLVLKDGSTAGMFSTAGVLNAGYPVSVTEWSRAVCYFSLIADNIRLELI